MPCNRAMRALMFSMPPRVPVRQRGEWVLARGTPRLPPLAWNPPRARGPGGVGGDGVPRLRVVRIRGDGRCLFRAIARGIAHSEGRRLTESLEVADADALRSIAWKIMCVDKRKEYEAKHIVEGNMRSYCSMMRSPTFFGGEAEVLSLSDAMKVPIAIYLRDQTGKLRNIMTYGEDHKARKGKPDRTVRVLYNGTNHYDAILPM